MFFLIPRTHKGMYIHNHIIGVCLLSQSTHEKHYQEALSVLMLCAPSNRRRPLYYHTKMADFGYFRILSVFS